MISERLPAILQVGLVEENNPKLCICITGYHDYLTLSGVVTLWVAIIVDVGSMLLVTINSGSILKSVEKKKSVLEKV